MTRLGMIVFLIYAVILAVLGVFSQWPTTITPDAAMHAEIVEIIKVQGFIQTWEPYAQNEFTYPPLFHYATLMLPLESIDAVRALGLVIWLLFPLAMYFFVSTYNKKAAIPAAFFVGLVPSFATVFIYSEFPQLLAMLLLVWQWYFLRKERYGVAGVLVGLIALTHVFFVIIAGALYVCYLYASKEWRYLFYVFVPVLVGLPWLHAYGKIVRNVLTGAWENTRYNAMQPVFGFWPWETIKDWLFGMHGLTIALVVLALYGFFKTKDHILRGVFILSLIFTMFHIPFTQLKIYDFLALPMIMLAALGIAEFPVKRLRTPFIVVVVIFLAFAQVQHFQAAQKFWLNPEIAPTEELADAAEWLGNHDDERVRIYAHQASAWAGILSHKLPLNPDITHLEAFSDAYKEQLAYREKVKNALENGSDVRTLLAEWNVKYAIVPIELKPSLNLIYTNGVWGVYE